MRLGAVALALAVTGAASAWGAVHRWEPYPPGVGGPWGGSVRKVASPGDPGNAADPRWRVLWAATGGGVFGSTDGGRTWHARNQGLESLDVNDLDVCRSDPTRLIAATRGGGLHLSRDGGATWRRVAPTALDRNARDVEDFGRVAVDPGNCARLFAATDATRAKMPRLLAFESPGDPLSNPWRDLGDDHAVSRLAVATDGTVFIGTKSRSIFRYRPSDSKPLPLRTFGARVADLALPGGDGTRLAAAVEGAGLWVSTDSGASWSERHGTKGEFSYVVAVGADPGDADRIFYQVTDPSQLYELRLSSGTRAALAPPEESMEVLWLSGAGTDRWVGEHKGGLFCRRGGEGAFGHCSVGLAAYSARDLAFGPAGAVAVAGGDLGPGNGGVNRWDGTAWTRLAKAFGAPSATTFPAASTGLVRYRGTELWLAVTGWGLYRTADHGATWVGRSQGFGFQARRELLGLEFSAAFPERAVAGTGGGVYRTADGGANWAVVPSIPQATGWVVARDARSPRAFFAGGPDGGDGLIFRSADDGETWSQVARWAGVQVKGLVASPRDGTHLLAGGNGVQESRDGGVTWRAAADGGTGLPAGGTVTALAIADREGDDRMAAAVDKRVYLTTDGGASWTTVTAGLAVPGSDAPSLVYALRFEPDARRLVAAVDGRGLWFLTLPPPGPLDLEPPVSAVAIDGGAATTASRQVTLTLAATDDSGVVPWMRLSQDGVTWGPWEEYSSPRAWTLVGGEGQKAVHVQFRDEWDNISPGVRATIELKGLPPDTQPPVGTVAINGRAATTASRQVTLTLEASDDSGAVAEMRLCNEGSGLGDWEPYAASRTWTLTEGDGRKTVTAEFRDEAGNVSAAATASIQLATAPTDGGGGGGSAGGGGGGSVGGGCFVQALGGGVGGRLLAAAGLLLALGVGSRAWAAGPFGGTVNGLVLGADGRTPAWAATARGLFRMGAQGWSRVAALGQRDLLGVVAVPGAVVVTEARVGVLRSDDLGRSWGPVEGLRGRYGHRVDDVRVLVQDRADPSRLYLGGAGQGPFESRDGGATWRLLLAGLEEQPPPALHPTALLPPDGDRPLLLGTDGAGLFAWRGDAWAPLGEGLPERLRVQGLAARPGEPGRLLLASRGGGVWESRDGGARWSSLRRGAFGIAGALALGSDGAALVHFPEEGLFWFGGAEKPQDRGLGAAGLLTLVPRAGGGWLAGLAHDGVLEVGADGVPGALVNHGLEATQVSALALGEAPEELWAGDANGVFRSADGGRTWEPRDQGLLGAPVSALRWAGGRLYLGSLGQGVFRWNPEAGSWEERSGGLGTSNTIFSLAVDADGQRLYVATEGGIYASDDGGGRWTARRQGLPSAAAWVAAASPSVSGRLWAAAAGAVFASADGGDAWAPAAQGQPLALVPARRGGAETVWVIEAGRAVPLGGEPGAAAVPPGETLFTAAPQGEDGLWLGGSAGLRRLDDGPAELLWREAGIRALLPTPEGLLFVGTDGRGVVRFRLPGPG